MTTAAATVDSSGSSKWLRGCWVVLRLSVITLPYASYLALVGIGVITLIWLAQFRKTALDRPLRYGLMAVSALMAASTAIAYDHGEAYLQLFNFFPFFLFFATLPLVVHKAEQLERLAMDVVLAAVPINLISVGEYVLKARWLPFEIRRLPWVKWVRSAPHKGRAMVMFDHPNAMAAYLVLILGLGLGLVVCQLVRQRAANQGRVLPEVTLEPVSSTVARRPLDRFGFALIATATLLNLVGIFCSGSRNGLAIALVQLVAFSGFVGLVLKVSRRWLLVALGSGLGLLGIAAALGIGGRSLSVATWGDDPRLRVWQIAWTLIVQRPWLGWGLGNYKLVYPSLPHDPEYPTVFHTHNVWLLLASEAGLPVMILLTLGVGYVCVKALQALAAPILPMTARAVLLGYGLGFGGCVAFALFDVTFYDSRSNIMNWVLLSGLFCFTQWAKRSTGDRPSNSPL